MKLQANCVRFSFDDVNKYEVGRLLRFVEHDPSEVIVSEFEPGDVVKVCERNGCGLGIDVIRISDGFADMVWSNEVELIGENNAQRI